MKKCSLLFSLSFCIAHLCLCQNIVVLHQDSSGAVISKNIYGHFAEHLGHCIYGGFYVGDTNKIIPNTEGVRNDVITALRKLKIPVLCLPGGCFADTYHWKDGIGRKNKRPSMVNKWWGGVTEDQLRHTQFSEHVRSAWC